MGVAQRNTAESSIFNPNVTIEALLKQFPEIKKFKTAGESLPQEVPTQLVYVNYFQTLQTPAVVQLPNDNQGTKQARILKGIDSAFDPVRLATSRANLVMLLDNLVTLARVVEDANDGLDIFYNFNGKIGVKVNTVVSRAAREAHGIAGWRRVSVFQRDLALANKMSDLYAFVSVFGGNFKDLPFGIFNQIINAYVGTVRLDMREAGDNANADPGDYLQNGIVAGRFIFGKVPNFDTRVTFRGANHSGKLVYRERL